MCRAVAQLASVFAINILIVIPVFAAMLDMSSLVAYPTDSQRTFIRQMIRSCTLYTFALRPVDCWECPETGSFH